MKCPSCSYERCETDEAPEWQCPSCQRAYNKHPDFKNASLQKPTEIFQKHKHTILLSRKKILVLALVVVSLLYLYIKKNDTIKPKVTINNEFQELGNNRLIKAKNQESDFNKYHVDLYLLSSKSYTAYELIKDCKNSCQKKKHQVVRR